MPLREGPCALCASWLLCGEKQSLPHALTGSKAMGPNEQGSRYLRPGAKIRLIYFIVLKTAISGIL